MKRDNIDIHTVIKYFVIKDLPLSEELDLVTNKYSPSFSKVKEVGRWFNCCGASISYDGRSGGPRIATTKDKIVVIHNAGLKKWPLKISADRFHNIHQIYRDARSVCTKFVRLYSVPKKKKDRWAMICFEGIIFIWEKRLLKGFSLTAQWSWKSDGNDWKGVYFSSFTQNDQFLNHRRIYHKLVQSIHYNFIARKYK